MLQPNRFARLASKRSDHQNGFTYLLTSKGYGLQTYREAEGGVRGDAYRDYLTLPLPNKVMISCDVTEDSYQPEIIFTLIGVDQKNIDEAGKVLSDEMKKRVVARWGGRCDRWDVTEHRNGRSKASVTRAPMVEENCEVCGVTLEG